MVKLLTLYLYKFFIIMSIYNKILYKQRFAVHIFI